MAPCSDGCLILVGGVAHDSAGHRRGRASPAGSGLVLARLARGLFRRIDPIRANPQVSVARSEFPAYCLRGA